MGLPISEQPKAREDAEGTDRRGIGRRRAAERVRRADRRGDHRRLRVDEQAVKFGGYIDPVTVAHNVLTEDYGLSGSEATETIRTVVQNECPQYRGQL
jgi:hypothetical protein